MFVVCKENFLTLQVLNDDLAWLYRSWDILRLFKTSCSLLIMLHWQDSQTFEMVEDCSKEATKHLPNTIGSRLLTCLDSKVLVHFVKCKLLKNFVNYTIL